MGALGAFNPSFLSQGPQFQPESPIQTYGKYLSLRAMMDQQKVRAIQLQTEQMQLQQAQQAQQDRARLSSYVQSADLTTPQGRMGLYGIPGGAAIAKSLTDADRDQVVADKDRHELNAKNSGDYADAIFSLGELPPDPAQRLAQYQSSAQKAYQNKVIDQTALDNIMGLTALPSQQALAAEGMRFGGAAHWFDLQKRKAENELAAATDPQKRAEAQAKAEEATIKANVAAESEARQQLIGMTDEKGNVDPDAYAAWYATTPKSVKQSMASQPIPKQIAGFIRAGMTPEQLSQEAGRKETADIARSRVTLEEKKLQQQADPLGLGQPTTGAPAGGPSPLAQSIADFEGYGKQGSVAQRNNNPGNLRAGPGQTGTDEKGYAIFPDAATGWAALEKQITSKSGKGLTLQEFFGGKPGVYPGYAPAADRNNPQQYAATVAQRLGVDPTAPLDTVIGGSSAPAGQQPADMTGQALIDRLNTMGKAGIAKQVQALAEGRMNFPTGQALKSAYWQQMLGLVGQYDPTFDANNPGKRAATAKDFASGKSAQQVNALNTVIGHLNSFSANADRLNNTSWQPYNTLKNFIAAKTGDSDITRFEANRKAVVDELTRVWRGTGGSEADIKAWSDVLSSSESPEQLHAAIAQIGDLLESNLKALEDQYTEGMGTIGKGRRMITDESRKTLDVLERKAGKAQPAAQEQYVRTAAGPNGHRIGQKADGSWYDVQTGNKLQ